MKKLNFLFLTLFAVFACVSFASCSDDNKDDDAPAIDVTGTWECVTDETHGGDYAEHDFAKGTLLKFMKGGKCFIGYHGSFDCDPTEEAWNKLNKEGEADSWTLEGNVLTVMECDLDRHVGTISLNGNEMTFTYKYQNWNSDSNTMTSESGPYTSKFKKK